MQHSRSDFKSPNLPLVHVFKRLIQSDRVFRFISSITVSDSDPHLLLIRVEEARQQLVCKKLPQLAQQLQELAGDRFRLIQVNEDILPVEILLKMAAPEGSALVEQAMRRYRTEQVSVSIVSTTGVFKHIDLSPSTLKCVQLEQIVGKSVDEVLPLETAFWLLQNLQEAYAAGEARVIQFRLGGNSCRTEIRPIDGAGEVILACACAIVAEPNQPSDALHSLESRQAVDSH